MPNKESDFSALNIEVTAETTLADIYAAARNQGLMVTTNGFGLQFVKSATAPASAIVEPAPVVKPSEPDHFNVPPADFGQVLEFDRAVARYKQLDPNSFVARRFRQRYLDNPHGMAAYFADK